MSARMGQRRRGGWTAAQDAIIRNNPDWTSAQIAEAANLIGETRTVGAADSRRRLLGLATPPGGSKGQYALYIATRTKPNPDDPQWPSMRGSDEARDHAHVQAYLNASLTIVRARERVAA